METGRDRKREAAVGGGGPARRTTVLAETIGVGAQHVVAMFGATFVFPLIMGLNANLAILVAGLTLAAVGVLIHLVGGRVVRTVLPPVVSGAVVMLIGFNLARRRRRVLAAGSGGGADRDDLDDRRGRGLLPARPRWA